MDGGGWYRPVGNIEWSADPAGHEELAARVRRLAGWGYPASLIGAAQAAELEPSLRPRGLPAAVAWFPEEGYLVTEDLIADMVQRAVHDGVTMLTGEPGRVTGFDVAAGAVQAVRTAAGASIPADAVVLCAGRSVPGLAALAGAAGPIPLVRWAGPGAAAPGLVVRAGPVAPPGLTRVVHAPGVYLRPHPGGLVHIEAPDAAVDLHTPRADLRWWADELLARARRAVPGLDQAEVTAYRVCVRPMPADGQSVLGWLPGIRGLYVAVTHSGVTLAAHLAQLVATELLTATVTGLGPYRPGRFAPATA